MRHSATKTNRLTVWSDSLLNKLPAQSRKKRKRQASKKRRAMLRSEDARAIGVSVE
jgi:hypothetical protein